MHDLIPKTVIRVLLLEDTDSDAELVVRELTRAQFRLITHRVQDGPSFQEALDSFKPDAIVADFLLPQYSAIDALEVMADRQRRGLRTIPFVLVTGSQSEEVAAQCIKAGADDYLLKSGLRRLPIALANAIARHQDQWQRSRYQQQFESFMEHLPGIAFIKDQSGRLLFANQRTRSIFEDANMPAVGAISSEFPDQILANEWEVNDKRVLSTLMPAEVIEHTPATSGYRSWLIRKFPLQPSPSDTPLLGGVGFDITERLASEESLRQSVEQFKLLFEGTKDLIWNYDVAANKLTWNDAICTKWGYGQDELQSTLAGFISKIHPDEFTAIQQRLEQALDKELAHWTFDCHFRHADGSYVPVNTRVHFLYGADGAAVRALAMMVDISDRKIFEDQLMQARERAEEMSRVKSNFLANMSHEVRTPMTAILGFCEVLEESLTGDSQELVRIVHRSGRRLLETINGILDIAKIEANKWDLRIQEIEVEREVEEVIQLLRPLATQKNLELKMEIATPGATVYADINGLHRVLYNLIGNAIKFTTKGAITVRVRPSVRRESMAIVIEDTGVGIDTKSLPHIFDQFRQGSEGIGRAFEGSGLGLTIARHLVEGMSGSIDVQSSKSGSIFTVRLPCAPKQDILPASGAVANITPFPPVSQEVVRKPRVLAVDDDPDVLTLLRVALGTTLELRYASTLDEAKSELRSGAIQAVLLDVNLGATSARGQDLIHFAKQDKIDTAFIACTGYAMLGDRERFLAAGFDEYIAKPFTRARVLDVLNQILNSRQTPANLQHETGKPNYFSTK